MRDINRIPVFLKKLEECWSKAPDLRFGQFITDFFRICTNSYATRDFLYRR